MRAVLITVLLLPLAVRAQSYVNSSANYCTNSGGGCQGPNLTATAGNTAVALVSYPYACSGPLGAKLSGGNALAQIGSTVNQSFLCAGLFVANSLPVTGTEYVTGTGMVGTYGSIAVIQFSNASGGLDQNCSGTSASSPTACSPGFTTTHTAEVIVAGYADYYANGTISASGSGMTDAAQYVGSQGAAAQLALAYRIVGSSGTYTPSFTDSNSQIYSTIIAGALIAGTGGSGSSHLRHRVASQ